MTKNPINFAIILCQARHGKVVAKLRLGGNALSIYLLHFITYCNRKKTQKRWRRLCAVFNLELLAACQKTCLISNLQTLSSVFDHCRAPINLPLLQDLVNDVRGLSGNPSIHLRAGIIPLPDPNPDLELGQFLDIFQFQFQFQLHSRWIQIHKWIQIRYWIQLHHWIQIQCWSQFPWKIGTKWVKYWKNGVI